MKIFKSNIIVPEYYSEVQNTLKHNLITKTNKNPVAGEQIQISFYSFTKPKSKRQEVTDDFK